jgi:TolA-binding protein
LGLALAACGGALADGESQFKKGHYPEAKQTFASIEGESRSYADSKRAEYALYRGMTLAALGDHAQAGTWLREAKAIEDTHPDSLSHEDALRLKEAMAANEGP